MTHTHTNLPLANSSNEWRILSEINLPRQPNAEKLAMELVAHIIEDLQLPAGRLEQLKQAIAAATSNAINQKNLGKAELPVSIRILASSQIVELHEAKLLEITSYDSGKADQLKNKDVPHGWGFFLIDRTLATQPASSEGAQQRIELFIYMEGRKNLQGTIDQ